MGTLWYDNTTLRPEAVSVLWSGQSVDVENNYLRSGLFRVIVKLQSFY